MLRCVSRIRVDTGRYVDRPQRCPPIDAGLMRKLERFGNVVRKLGPSANPKDGIDDQISLSNRPRQILRRNRFDLVR